MNTKHLQYLLEIARCGSINQAAYNLFISQPTLSGVIKSVQEEIGYTIFTTGPSGTSPTKEGRLFLQAAENIVSEIDRMHSIPDLLKPQNSLSICCNYSSSMMKLFLDFSETNGSSLQDRFKETGIAQAIRDAITNAYRLTFFYTFDSRREKHFNALQRYNFVIAKLSGPVPVSCLVSPDHHLSQKQFVTLKDLESEKYVCFEDFGCADWFGPLGIICQENYGSANILHVFDRGGMIEAIAGNQYVAIIPRHPNDRTHYKNLVHLPLVDAADTLHWYMTFPKNYKMNPREAAFYKQVRRAMNQAYPQDD